jgi:hypothetical protein
MGVFSMRKFIISVVFLTLAISVDSAFGQGEKDLVIKTARALETAPLASDTVKMREKALVWVIETDQVHLIVCGEVFSLYSDKKNKNASEMTAAYTIGMAAFKLENPEKASVENAAQVAGIETALKAYEAIVKEKPKTKFDKIDLLLEKRNGGQLADLIKSFQCSKK